jgi:uncharacterized coiled-coil DUF342 family protein
VKTLQRENEELRTKIGQLKIDLAEVDELNKYVQRLNEDFKTVDEEQQEKVKELQRRIDKVIAECGVNWINEVLQGKNSRRTTLNPSA